MTSYSDDFQKRILYTQASVTEEGYKLTSTIYAIKWTYPSATQSTTGRFRITCVYSSDSSGLDIAPVGGSIERWSDKAWLHIDDYCDNVDFISKNDFRDRLLNMAHSFIMGVPISLIEKNEIYNPKPPKPPKSPSKFKPKVLEFDKLKKNKNKNSEAKNNHSEKDTSSTDDDFEFL